MNALDGECFGFGVGYCYLCILFTFVLAELLLHIYLFINFFTALVFTGFCCYIFYSLRM